MAIGGQSLSSSNNSASSVSQTFGTEATNKATQAALTANSAANAAWEKAAAYNAEQAAINREWQERMANTVYQRTVADMKKAGINPILAASMGLGTAGTTSGATASMGNPMSYMANTYADSMSASQSHGSSWSESMSGIALIADALKDWANAANSSNNITIALQGLEQVLPNYDYTTSDGETHNTSENRLKEGHDITNQLLTESLSKIGEWGNKVISNIKNYLQKDWENHMNDPRRKTFGG